MKKVLPGLLTLIALPVLLCGQSIELSLESGEVIPGGYTVNVTDAPTASALAAHVYVKNISTETRNVLVKKVILLNIEGSMNTFCWAGSCYGPNTYVSPSATVLLPGETATDFAGDLSPNGNEGIGTIMYVWFDENNTSDSAYVYVNFNTMSEKSLAISNDSGEFIDGQVITVDGMDQATILMDMVRVINFHYEEAHVKVMKIINAGDTVSGSANTFFWGSEYAAGIYESGSMALPTEGTYFDFVASLHTNETSGVSTISYKFFNADNAADFVTITVKFDAKTSGVAEKPLAGISGAYPNPADKLVNFDVRFIKPGTDARIVIRNLLGETVGEGIIADNTIILSISTSGLAEGMYVYSLLINGKIVSTKKLVVGH